MGGEEMEFIVLLYLRPEWHSAHGRVRVGNRFVAVDVSHPPDSGSLRLSVLLVVGVAETGDIIQPLLDRANTARHHSHAWHDPKDRCLRAEAEIPCAERGHHVLAQAKRVDVSDFASLLNDGNLLQALELSKGRLLGTPTDLFDGNE
jgi:hypothetical protein